MNNNKREFNETSTREQSNCCQCNYATSRDNNATALTAPLKASGDHRARHNGGILLANEVATHFEWIAAGVLLTRSEIVNR